MLVYVPIFLFAIIEGEIYYIAMCVAAAAGKLNWAGVMVAGAAGGSAGDQFSVYLPRGRLHWPPRHSRRSRKPPTANPPGHPAPPTAGPVPSVPSRTGPASCGA